MQTHTIRNKTSPTPILSFTPKFLAVVLRAQPEAAALTLDWFKRQYKTLTGKAMALDYEQSRALLARAGADEQGRWQSRFSGLSGTDYKVVTLFEQGFLSSGGMTFDEALAVADAFYSAMTRAYELPAARL
jgi:sigma54-dependent transcription regulator